MKQKNKRMRHSLNFFFKETKKNETPPFFFLA